MMDLFNSLPLQLQHRIDRVFDLENEPSPDIDQHGLCSQIPLSSIPSALQSLDLPPDDDQVLSVFWKAASGWNVSSGDIKEGEWMVSRDDWRSVCAVLFESHEENIEFGGLHESDREMEYEESLASGRTDDGSDDEYLESLVASSSHRRTHSRRSKHEPDFSSTSSSPTKHLSLRQQQTCLQAFTLFFPSVPASEVANQKIMMKDIQRVSELLGEKIKANEVHLIFLSPKYHQ